MNYPIPNQQQRKSDFDRLADLAERYPSQDKFILYRNLYLGAAAACLVLITQLLDTGVSSFPLKLSLSCAAGAIPVWLCLATMFEYYVLLGPKSYPHKRSPFPNGTIAILVLIGGSALGTSLGAVLHHLHPVALSAYLGAVILAVAVSVHFHWHLAKWYFSRERNEAGDT